MAIIMREVRKLVCSKIFTAFICGVLIGIVSAFLFFNRMLRYNDCKCLGADDTTAYSDNHKHSVTKPDLDPTPTKQEKVGMSMHQNDVIRAMKNELFGYLAGSSLKNTAYPGIANYTSYTVIFRDAQPLKDVKAIKHYGPVFNDVENFRYNDVNFCHRANNRYSIGTNKIKLIFLAIISAPRNFGKREAIRKTWLPLANNTEIINSIRVNNGTEHRLELADAVFVIGTTDNIEITQRLQDETTKYGDILQVGVRDTYYELAIKNAALFNYIDKHCKRIDFIFKVDDDVFVNVRNLGSFIRNNVLQCTFEQRGPFVAGTKATYEVVARGDNNKWKMMYDEYPWENYPKYFLGPAVLISKKAVRPLLGAMQTIPYHKIDDVYLTGLCAERANLTHLQILKGFYVPEGFGREPKPCEVVDSVSWLLHDDTEKKMHWHNAKVENVYADTDTSPRCTRPGSETSDDPFKPLKLNITYL